MDKYLKNSPIHLPWMSIDSVLLDMDGTLLDLHFDNYFWNEYIPAVYSKQTGQSLDECRTLLKKYSNEVRGQLEWYCLDYWSDKLSLDIPRLKMEIGHKIGFRPNVIEFLSFLKRKNKRIILATNAHPKALELKLLRADFSDFFEVLSSSHDIGFAKEDNKYWEILCEQYQIEASRSLFIDDSLTVLKSADNFGIEHVLGIAQPDSQEPEVDCAPYTSIQDFSQLF